MSDVGKRLLVGRQLRSTQLRENSPPNRVALRLKGRLLFTPGVVVTSVPYVLQSGGRAGERVEADDASGSVPPALRRR